MALSVGHLRGTHSLYVIGCCLIPFRICGLKNNSRQITCGIGCVWGCLLCPLYPLLPHHIQDQRFNDFKNDTTKLSVDKAKLTSLCARDSANIQQVLILKFVLEPEKFPGLSRRETVPGAFALRHTIWKLLKRIM